VDGTPLIVIFGAVVRPDGTPSAALLRRIGYGCEAAQAWPSARILCSGGGDGRSEASVMARELVTRGVAADRLVLDEISRNTLANVAAAAAQMRQGGEGWVLACSDAYHLPRARLLMALHGVRSRAWRGRDRPPAGHQIAMAAREAIAIPNNLARLLARRIRRTS